MRIICPKCGTEYFLESKQLDREGTPVQCSACEHTFSVFPTADTGSAQAAPGSPARNTPQTPQVSVPAVPRGPKPRPKPRNPALRPPPKPVRSRSASLFLAQGDRVYKVKDLTTLQRWIVEKRVLPDDRVSSDGKSWEVVSQRSDMRPFFAIIDQLKAAKKALKRKTREVSALSEEAEVQRRSGSLPSTARSQPITFAEKDEDHTATPSVSMPAASTSRSGGIQAPESVPRLDAISNAQLDQAASDAFFSTSERSIRSDRLPPGSEASGKQESRDDSFYDFGPDDEDPDVGEPTQRRSFGRMHSIKTSGEFERTPVPQGSSFEDERAASSAPQDSFGPMINPSSQSASGSGSGSEEFSFSSGASSHDAAAASDDANFQTTRQVPTRGRSFSEHAEDDSSLHKTERAVAPARVAVPDFDPDQTFSGDSVSRRGQGSGGFYFFLLLLLAGGVGAMWYFLLGPGRGEVFELGPEGAPPIVEDSSSAAASGAEDAEASAETSAAEGEDSPDSEATDGSTADEDEAEEAAASEPEAEAVEPPPAEAAEPEPPTPAPEPVAAAEPRPSTRPAPSATTASSSSRSGSESSARSTPSKSPTQLLAEADRARDRGSFSSAASSYSEVLEADPKNFKAALQLGWMNIELGRNSAAVAAFKRALGIRSSNAEAHYGLGLAYEGKGQVSQAITQFERALELDPEGRDAREIRAVLATLK